jgi:hypothetical protein
MVVFGWECFFRGKERRPKLKLRDEKKPGDISLIFLSFGKIHTFRLAFKGLCTVDKEPLSKGKETSGRNSRNHLLLHRAALETS